MWSTLESDNLVTCSREGFSCPAQGHRKKVFVWRVRAPHLMEPPTNAFNKGGNVGLWSDPGALQTST